MSSDLSKRYKDELFKVMIYEFVVSTVLLSHPHTVLTRYIHRLIFIVITNIITNTVIIIIVIIVIIVFIISLIIIIIDFVGNCFLISYMQWWSLNTM